jgi:hypothetical protein
MHASRAACLSALNKRRDYTLGAALKISRYG